MKFYIRSPNNIYISICIGIIEVFFMSEPVKFLYGLCFSYLVSLFLLFWKNENNLMQSPYYVCLCIPPTNLNAWISFIKPGTNILAPQPISAAYLKTPLSMCLCVYLSYCCQAKARQNVSFLSLLGNGSVNIFPQRRMHASIWRNCWTRVSVCFLCIPLSLLAYNSVKTFPRQRITFGSVVFYAVHVASRKVSDYYFPEFIVLYNGHSVSLPLNNTWSSW
jgi:hypothetical protein